MRYSLIQDKILETCRAKMGPSPARESFWKGWGAARLSRDQLVVGDPGGWSLSNDSGSIVEDVDLYMDGWMEWDGETPME